MNHFRGLPEPFFDDLQNLNGLLHPLLERVKQDDSLMLALRGNRINIYYRGGNLIRITFRKSGTYQAFFDRRYNKTEMTIPDLPEILLEPCHMQRWIEELPRLKEVMDFYFSQHDKHEREFQQLIARENNRSRISNETEYFISDIEFADSDLGARFDMLGIRWCASERKDGRNCRAALLEVKYGDGALGGSAGLLKHLQDIDALISDARRYEGLLETMESQFNQLNKLGLMKFNQCSNGTTAKLNAADIPEVILILVNHNPRSTKLRSILNNPKIVAYEQNQRFALRFFVSSFAGYGLHADCMLPLADFRRCLK